VQNAPICGTGAAQFPRVRLGQVTRRVNADDPSGERQERDLHAFAGALAATPITATAHPRRLASVLYLKEQSCIPRTAIVALCP